MSLIARSLTRRSFVNQTLLTCGLAAMGGLRLSSSRARAEGTLGSGKKLLFIFLRGGNDGLNSLIPIEDPAYATSRPTIAIPKQPGLDYTTTGECFDPTRHLTDPGAGYDPNSAPTRLASDATYSYGQAIRTGNGFAALHPALKFLAPVYNAGHLALVHRVGYPKQPPPSFQAAWQFCETAVPGDLMFREGVWNRTIFESGLALAQALTGVSFYSQLPISLQGSRGTPMLNVNDPTRLTPLGLPGTTAGRTKAQNAITDSLSAPFPSKKYRAFLGQQYQLWADLMPLWQSIDFTEAGNTFVDGNFPPGQTATDSDTVAGPYYLFPTTLAKNGGYAAHGTDPAKQVTATAYQSFFTQLKNAALVLGRTSAFIAATEYGESFNGFFYNGAFYTAVNQGGVTGTHAELLKPVGWALYALYKFFSNPVYAPQCSWNNLVIVVISEFGRATLENPEHGTTLGLAGVMFVAGGAVNGFNATLNRSGVYACHNLPANATYNGNVVNWTTGNGGSMFAFPSNSLGRAVDFRSVLGEIIRDHLGATQGQLNRIIPGYANESTEHLAGGGDVTPPTDFVTAKIAGELDLV